MLNKLKSWKDSLIDKVTNVSLKNIKVSKTSFRVHTFVLSMVLVCVLSTIMILNKTLFSNAAGLTVLPTPLTNVTSGTITYELSDGVLTVTGSGTLTGNYTNMIWYDGCNGSDIDGNSDTQLFKEFTKLRIIGTDTTNMIKFPSNLTCFFDGNGGGTIESVYLENVDLSDVTNISSMFVYAHSFFEFKTKNCTPNANPLTDTILISNSCKSGAIGTLDFSCFDFTGRDATNTSLFYDNRTTSIEEFILPLNCSANIFELPSTKPYEVYCGFDSDDNLVQRGIKKGDSINSNVKYLKTGPKLLYTDPLTNIEYYSDGTTSDTSVDPVSILKGDFYITNGSTPDTNVNAIWDISLAKNNSLRAYIFNDGLMIFDGAGECFDFTNYHNLKYTNGGNALYTENNAPINKVKKIVASNDGFAPTGTISVLFASVGNKSQLETVDLTRMNFSGVTRMTSLFENDINLTNIIGLDSIDTSSCTHFNRMFMGCKSLTSIDITHFNTDKALEIENMFNNCRSITSIDVSYLNTKKVQNFGGLFAYCNSLEHINISNFKGQPTNVDGMFNGLTSLKTPIVFPSDFSKFTGDDINDITSFDVSKINKFSGFYQNSTTPYVTYWDLSMFSHCDNPITSAEYSCYQLYGTINLSGVDLSGLTQTSSRTYVFGKDNQTEIILPKKVPSENHYIAREAKDGDDNWFKYIWHGYDINGDPIDYYVIDTKLPAADPGDDGVFQAGELYKIKKEIAIYYIDNEGTDDEVVYKYDGAYNKAGTKIYNCASYTNNLTRESEAPSYSYRSICAFLYGDGTFILHGLGDVKEVGNGYNDKGEIPWRKDGKIKKIKRVLGSRYGFIPYGSMQSYFDMNTTTATNYTYYPTDDSVDSNNQHLELVDFTNIDTSNVTDFSLMFNGCRKLETIIGFENIKTNKVENFYRAFLDCSNLKFTNDTLDISNWNISNARDFTEAFCGVNVTNVKMDGVTFNSNGVSLSRMFATIGGPKNISIKNTISSEYINSVHDIFSTNFRGAKVDLTGMKLNGLTNAENWGNPNNISEIILPDECDSDVTIAPIGDTTFFAYDINGNKLGNKAYGKLIAAEGNTPGKIYKLVRENCELYKDNDANVSYYRTGTSKNSGTDLITLATYDDDNDLSTPEIDCVWNLSTDGSITAYLYTDGTLILDGEGTIDNVTNNGNDNNEICHIIYPWRQYKKLESIKKVVGSINGFTPHGSIESLLDFKIDTTYYQTPTNNNSIEMTHNLNYIDLTNFNTSNVTNMRAAFRGIRTNLTFKGLKSLDVSKVINFSDMFNGIVPNNGSVIYDLDGWILKPLSDIDMSNMFAATKISILSKIGNWTNTSSIANISGFASAGYVFTLDMSSWDLTNSNLKNSDNYLGFISNTYSINTINLPNSLDSDCILTLPTKNYYSWYGYDSLGAKTGDIFTTLIASEGEGSGNNVTIKQEHDVLYEKDGVIYYKDGTNKTGDDAITLDKYDHDNNDATPQISCVWDISASKNKSMYAYLYTDGTMIFDGKGSNDYYFNAENRPWDSIKDKVKRVYASNGGFQPTYLNYYFEGCSNLETFDDTRFDLTNVTYLYGMFEGCSKITSIKLTTKPQNLSENYNLFEGCTNLQTLDLSGFNGYKLNSNSKFLFFGCNNLATITGLSDIDFSSVNNAFGMFSGCNKLSSIEINSLTSVTSLKQMFLSNNELTTLKLNNLNTTNVDSSNYNSMFGYNSKLSSLDLKNANISNMPSTIINDITSLREVILPSDVPALADAIVLPAVTDHVWFGYAIDGTTKVGGMFTTIPKAGVVPDLYMIKLESYTTMFSIDGTNYDSSDLICKWDVSQEDDEGNIFAYYFSTNGGTIILNDESTDGNTHYIMHFDDFERAGNVNNQVSSFDSISEINRDVYVSNNNNKTPWSIACYHSSDFGETYDVKHLLLNTPINFNSTTYLYADTSIDDICIDSKYVFTDNTYEGQYSYVNTFAGLGDDVKIKFTSNQIFRDFRLYFINGYNYILDLSDINITNHVKNQGNFINELYTAPYDTLNYFYGSYKAIYLPNKLIGFDSDTDKEKLMMDPGTLASVWNDNNTKNDFSDDIFLGYTDELIDKTCDIYHDKNGVSYYPSYISYVHPIDELLYQYIYLYNQYVDGNYIEGTERENILKNSPVPDFRILDLGLIFIHGQIEEYLEDYYSDLSSDRTTLFDDDSFNGKFKFEDIVLDFENNLGLDDGFDICNFVLDLFEFIKQKRIDEGYDAKIEVIDPTNEFFLNKNDNEFYLFKEYANIFVKELFGNKLIQDDDITVINYMDDIVLYVDSILDEAYRFFFNVDEEKDASDNLIFADILDGDTSDGTDIVADLIGDITVKAINKYFKVFNILPTLDNSSNDNDYTYNFRINALDISSSNTRVYDGDISSKVFDGVNPITCDSEVHLYYKNNEWQDGDDPIELVRGVDYQITGYSDNDKQGTATVHLQGISPNVTGTRDITFNIVNAIKKLNINNLTLSDSEKAGAIINKDGTDRDLDAISFNDANSNTLHPYILDSDGITPIYLSYTKAYVSDSDGYPNYIARAKDTSDPLAISNITFKGLKLVDQSGAYELYEDNAFNKLVSANNGNDTFTLNDSCKFIDLSSPKIDKIIITNNKNTKLKEEDIVNVSITFSEELNLHGLSDDTFANTYKDAIYLTYKIGLNSFSDYKLNLISIESPRALSVTNRKTVMKFSGKLPSDLGELIDVPFTLYELFMGSITDAELSDLSGNGHDISNFSTKINTPELTGYLVNTKVDEPDPIKPEPEKPITTQTITVQVVKNNKYIEGYSDGTFKPNDNITRGEFSKMLAYISNNYSDSNKLDYTRYINSFKDINASDWYSSYVGFNNKKQVMVGYSDGTFRPNKELTRAEAAKALTNMFSINNNNTNIASTFNNELNGKWYEYSMKKLINAGLLKGYPDGLLRPNDPITRAEMVALINRITNRDINNNAINNNSNLRNIPYDVDSNKWYYKDIISALNDY